MKDESSQSQLNTVLYVTLESLRIIAILLRFAMPLSMDRLLDILNVPKTERTFSNTHWEKISTRRSGLQFSPAPLFNRHR